MLDLDPKCLHYRHRDVDIFGFEIADHLYFQAVVGIGGDEQQRGEELAALAGVELGFSASESLGPHFYWQVSVGKARASVDTELAERVEQVGNRSALAHGLVAVDDEGPIAKRDIARDRPRGSARIANIQLGTIGGDPSAMACDCKAGCLWIGLYRDAELAQCLDHVLGIVAEECTRKVRFSVGQCRNQQCPVGVTFGPGYGDHGVEWLLQGLYFERIGVHV